MDREDKVLDKQLTKRLIIKIKVNLKLKVWWYSLKVPRRLIMGETKVLQETCNLEDNQQWAKKN